MDFDWLMLWKRHIGSYVLVNQLSRDLSQLDLTESQAIWALVNYRKGTAFPNSSDFIDWLGDAKALPSPLVAAGLLNSDQIVLGLAHRLQTLEAAWIPTQSTKDEMDDLERKLKAAL